MMLRVALVAIVAIVAAAAWLAGPDRAAASERRAAVADGAVHTEVGAKRKTKHGTKAKHSTMRVTVRPAYRTGRRVAPLFHPYDLYAYRRPFFVPGPPPGVAGIRRDGMGTAAYGFGAN